MKKSVIVLSILAIVTLSFAALRTRTASSEPSFVQAATTTLTVDGFVPEVLYVQKEGSVTFVNNSNHEFWPASNLHPNHGIYPEFDPREPIPVGASWTFTFTRPGTWGFHDHVRSYYTGIVHVSE